MGRVRTPRWHGMTATILPGRQPWIVVGDMSKVESGVRKIDADVNPIP